MPEESRHNLESVLQNVRTDRRAFLRALIVGSAGAAAALVPLSTEVSAARWFSRDGGDEGKWFNRGKGKAKAKAKGI